MLDTGFGDGCFFFATWQAWNTDPQHPRLLHYVAIAPVAPDRDALLRGMAAFPSLAADAVDLDRQWFGFLPGFHRIVLQRGQVLLTLCIGPLQAMLRQQQFVADAIYLAAARQGPLAEAWNRWNIKALTRLCRRGTTINIAAASAPMNEDMEQAGFVFEDHVPPAAGAGPAGHDVSGRCGQFQPRWEPGATRDTWRVAVSAASSCVVIGAGLAGALVAAALARRGWQVTVLDAAAQPATGASSLPVGLLAPQVSRDDSARSRLSRAGIRATLQLCHALLQQGEDWACSGVMELRRDGYPGLPNDWPWAGRQWSANVAVDDPDAARTNGLHTNAASIRHAAAGWIKPARLVQACLAQAGVQFIGNSEVHSLVRDAGQWELQDADGAVLARTSKLVVAAACNSVQLLNCAAGAIRQSPVHIALLATMNMLSGQISWGAHQSGEPAAFPTFPVNGRGSFVAHVPIGGALAWFAGATYAPGPAMVMDLAAGHNENLQRLSHLLPIVASTLTRRFSQEQVQAWTGTRCTTIDRLPAVGALDAGPQPSLWVSTGMGSRGLTYAALCAELLAARLGGEPLPIEASLAKCVAATRPQLLHHL